jgi:hypothetical protein
VSWVDTMTASKTPASRAAAIVYASTGWPANGLMFLSRTRSDPDRAGISATHVAPSGSGDGTSAQTWSGSCLTYTLFQSE